MCHGARVFERSQGTLCNIANEHPVALRTESSTTPKWMIYINVYITLIQELPYSYYCDNRKSTFLYVLYISLTAHTAQALPWIGWRVSILDVHYLPYYTQLTAHVFKLGIFRKLYLFNNAYLFRMVYSYSQHTRQVLVATDVLPRKLDKFKN